VHIGNGRRHHEERMRDGQFVGGGAAGDPRGLQTGHIGAGGVVQEGHMGSGVYRVHRRQGILGTAGSAGGQVLLGGGRGRIAADATALHHIDVHPVILVVLVLRRMLRFVGRNQTLYRKRSLWSQAQGSLDIGAG